MTVLDNVNNVQEARASETFWAWLMRVLFGSSAKTITAGSAPELGIGQMETTEEGTFVIAPGGYRIRVPQQVDLHNSLGDLLPSVKQGLTLIPPLPGVVIELLKEIQDPKATAASVANIIASDPAMAATLIRTVNSAAFALTRKITSVTEAVNYLGFSTVKTMVLRLQLDQVLTGVNMTDPVVHDLWVHCLIVSYIADVLAKKVPGVDRGFVSTLGLLHDIGKLVLHTKFPEQSAQMREYKNVQPGETMLAREAKFLGLDHAGMGAQLAAKWALPGDLVKAIRWHHFPERAFELSDPKPLHQAMYLLQIADQLAKYCYTYDDEMEMDAVSEKATSLLGFKPDFTSLLNGDVLEAASRAIFFANDEDSRSTKHAGAPRMAKLAIGERAATIYESAEPMVSRKRQVVVDDKLCSDCFNKEAGKTSQMNSPATETGVRTLAKDIEKKTGTYLFKGDGELAAQLVTRSVLGNVKSRPAGERILASMCERNGVGYLAIKSPAFAFANRYGADATTEQSAAALELELANLLNLKWFGGIYASSDGETLVFAAK